MVASIAGYRFEGPFSAREDIQETSGLLVAMRADHHNHGHALVDIVSSDDLRGSAADLASDPAVQAQGLRLLFAVRYCKRTERASLEARFRRDIDTLGYSVREEECLFFMDWERREVEVPVRLEFALLEDRRVGLVPTRRQLPIRFIAKAAPDDAPLCLPQQFRGRQMAAIATISR